MRWEFFDSNDSLAVTFVVLVHKLYGLSYLLESTFDYRVVLARRAIFCLLCSAAFERN
jgi:hypothetical protein